MATTFDTEPEAQAVAAELNAAAGRAARPLSCRTIPREVGDSAPERARILGLGRVHYARIRTAELAAAKREDLEILERPSSSRVD